MSLPKTSTSGFLLLEPLLAITLFAAFIVFFLVSFRNIYRTQDVNWRRVEAGIYAQEVLEIIYNQAINAEEWSDVFEHVEPNQAYSFILHPQIELVEGSEEINGLFERAILVEPAYRNEETGVLTSANDEQAIPDFQTVKVVSRVSWHEGNTAQQVEYVHYFAEP